MSAVGLEMFECKRLGVKLTRSACGTRHADAQRVGPSSTWGSAGGIRPSMSCRNCEIGETHERGEAHTDAPTYHVNVESLLERGRKQIFRGALAGDRSVRPPAETAPKIVEYAPPPFTRLPGRSVMVPLAMGGLPPVPATERRTAARALNAAFATTASKRTAPERTPAPTRETPMEATSRKCVMCGNDFVPQGRPDIARFCSAHTLADRSKFRYAERTGTPTARATKPKKANGKGNGVSVHERGGVPIPRRPMRPVPQATGVHTSAREALELMGFTVVDERQVPAGRLILISDQER